MKPFRRRDVHARFRELLATQMDVPLHLDEAWELNVHLSRCDRCRAAEREYREQRRALRALAEVPAPRDMWARTSAALDREMARPWRAAGGGDRARGVRARRRRRTRAQRHGASAAVSLVVISAAAMLTISQLPLLERAEPTRLRPTPFAVPVQALAYIGAGPEGFSIYRTNVDQVCPVSAADCVNEPEHPSAHRLPGAIEPIRLVLSPSGRQVAVTGIDGERDSVVAIVTMPEANGPPDPGAPASPSVGTTPRPVQATPPPLADAPATPVAPATVAPSASPIPELAVLAILEDAVGVGAPPAWSSDEQMLAFSAMPSDGSGGPDIYVWRPGDLAAQKLTDDQASYFASWSGGHIVASRVSGGETTDAPAATTLVIDPATGEEWAVDHPSLWLPQVNGPRSHAVAWQGTLAWRGSTVVPDSGALYLVEWASIDPFADEPADEPTDAPTDEPTDEPVDEPVDDPSTAPVESPDPAGEPSTEPEPTEGEQAAEPGASPAATATATATPFVVRLPSRRATTPPPDEPTPISGTTTPETPAPDATATPTDEPPTAAPATDAPSELPSEAPNADPDEDPGPLLQAIEPERDPADEPVRDWEVRWSPDGALLGFWIADVPGSSWGSLAVVPLDMESGALGLDAPLLSATLARRSFTLGADRVAWVAPVEHTPDGELRVTAWGPDGFGVLRLVVPDIEGAVSPF